MFTSNDTGFFVPEKVGQDNSNRFSGQQTKNEYGGNDNQQQKRKNRVFAPVTMHMIEQASPRPDDVCEIDGEAINDIIICGRVINKYEEPMRTLFEINDNTGTFKVIFYQKGEHEVPTALKNFTYEEKMYVKVYGTIRVFKEEKAIVGTHIKKVEKFDEVTNHMLQVFVASQIRKNGVLTKNDLRANPDQDQNAMRNSGMTGGNSMGQRSNMQGQGMDAKQSILGVMKELGKTNKFIHKNDIYGVVQQQMNQTDFDQAIQALAEDGVIYSTYDSDIFSITE